MKDVGSLPDKPDRPYVMAWVPLVILRSTGARISEPAVEADGNGSRETQQTAR